MTRPFRRLLVRLALVAGLGLGAPLAAHPLPGTVLTLSAQPDGVAITLALPLHELDLAMPAMPGGTGLGDSPPPGPLDPDSADRLWAYLADHLALQPAEGAALRLRLTGARIETASDKHAGQYLLLQVQAFAPLAEGQTPFPVTLQLDAVMHEVRSHRATVYLQPAAGAPVPLGTIRLDLATGLAPTLTIPAAL